MTIDESRRQFVRVRWKACRRGICLWSHDLPRSLFFKCTWFCKSGYTLIHILNDFADYLLGSCLFLASVSEFPSLTYWDESSGRVTGVFPREPLLHRSLCGSEWLVRMYIPLDDKEALRVRASCRFQGLRIKIIVLMSKSTLGQYFWQHFFSKIFSWVLLYALSFAWVERAGIM